MFLKYQKNFAVITLIILLLVILFLSKDYEFNEQTLLDRFSDNYEIIKSTCELVGISSRIYISVLYGELINNLDILDNFDELKAELGFDPSIGFGQMRLSTFLWLEENYSNVNFISKSENKRQLISKIKDRNQNILYTNFYVKLIVEGLIKAYNEYPKIRTIASYYGVGIDRDDIDYDSSYYNIIGSNAEIFYYSDKLIELYPRLK